MRSENILNKIYRDVRSPIYFSKDENGHMVLNREDGSMRTLEHPVKFRKIYEKMGWEMFNLFTQEYGIFDTMGFGTYVNCIVGLTVKDEFNNAVKYKSIIMISPQYAEKYLYNLKDNALIDPFFKKYTHEYLDEFYGNREMQLNCQKFLLQGVMFSINGFGEIMPLDPIRSSISDDILEKYDIKPVFDLEEYRNMIWERYHWDAFWSK